MNIFNLIKSIFGRFGKPEMAEYEPIISSVTQTQIELWSDMYSNAKNQTLELPSAIASEFNRLMLSESVIKIDGNDFLDKSFKKFYNSLHNNLETALALGGMVFKPYVSNGRIVVDMVRADCFTPISFDDEKMTSAVFVDRKKIGKIYYTRLEYHSFNVDSCTYYIENHAYKSNSSEYQGAECSLEEVPEWADIQIEITIENVSQPLFAYFKVPFVDSKDLDSPLGISVFSKAVKLIGQAEEQWERIMWEYDGTELAVDASEDVLSGKKLDRHEKRLYRSHDIDTINGSMFTVFSPAIRDTSLFNGLNKILQRIEFNCGLAYGTISEPAEIEKTATEILSSKQRSYTHVKALQKNLETALEQLAYAMSVYAVLYGFSGSEYELSCNWGDNVLEDSEKEFQRRLQMVSAGLLSKEKFVSWYFGCSEEEARTYIPETTELFGGV